MADDVSTLSKTVIIGGSEHIRDSDIIETLVEGVVSIGDSIVKGTAETQGKACPEGQTTGFKGICLKQSIRQLDTDDESTVLTVAKMMQVLKPTGGRVKVRAMAANYTTGATIPSGAPVYFNSTGSTIGAGTVAVGDFYVDPACSDDSAIVGHLAKAVVIPDGTTDFINSEIEFWY